MSHITVNPAGLHDPAPFGYSHTAAVPGGSQIVFIAGQYGSGPDGMVVSAEFGDQVAQALHNVGVALAAHGLDTSHVVQLRCYVVGLDFPKLGAVTGAVQQMFAGSLPTNTVLGVAALAMPDIVFEVEVVAARN
jgi:enamine deaminase RidA (YjgF/YER057c/UK114 family)